MQAKLRKILEGYQLKQYGETYAIELIENTYSTTMKPLGDANELTRNLKMELQAKENEILSLKMEVNTLNRCKYISIIR